MRYPELRDTAEKPIQNLKRPFQALIPAEQPKPQASKIIGSLQTWFTHRVYPVKKFRLKD